MFSQIVPRVLWGLFLVMVVGTGCIGCATEILREDTVKLASTAQDLQYQQVLYNLSLFLNNRNTLPSMVLVGGGQAQVLQQAALGATAVNPPGTSPIWSFPLATSHSATQKWDVKPVTDPHELERLRYLFNWAATRKKRPAKPAEGAEPAETAQATVDLVEPAKFFVVPSTMKTPADQYKGLPDEYRRWWRIGDAPASARFKIPHNGKTLYVKNERQFADFTLIVLGATPKTMEGAKFISSSNNLLSPN